MNASEQHSSKFKSVFKELLPAYIITFVFCYMLFVFEPMLMYSTNKEDFWFDFRIMAVPMISIFLMFFLGLAAVMTGLFFLCRLLSKKTNKLNIYNLVILLISWAFVVLYIQGNFLIKNLPVLDGSAINWDAYTKDDIITLVVWAVLGVVWIFALMKLDTGTFMKYAAGVSLAVFVMLNVSLVTTAVKNDLFESKNNLICTTEGFNTASSDKNFFIFMVDAQSASEFTQVILSQERFSHTFDDFTYYPDTTAIYPFTRDSVAHILSGHLNKNEERFSDYSERAFNDSALFKELDARGYDINLYDSELAWYGEKDFRIKNNLNFGNADLKFCEYFKQEMRYVWFKYLPYGLKYFSDIRHLDFGRTVEKFSYFNDVLYNEFKETPQLSKTSRAHFSFIHAEGAHVPFNMDENMNRIENGTYLQKTSATVELTAAFLKRLKENGVYDNSVIIIMADHGYITSDGNPQSNHIFITRLNPILLIKGVDEKHDLMWSDKPVSYFDLPQAYNDLLDGKQSAELFPEAEYPRTRTVIWYEYTKEDHMVEFQTDGKATEWDKFRETGNVFDLSKK